MPLRRLIVAVLAPLAVSGASMCSPRVVSGIDGLRGRVSPTRRPSSGATLAAPYEQESEVVEGTDMSEVVRNLNAISLERHRAHTVTADAPPSTDPFSLVADDIAPLSGSVCDQLSADQQTLMESAQYFFGAGNARQGKRVRPVIVLLMGQATAQPHHARAESAAADADGEGSKWYGKQLSLAAITEMIHTASLVHDDVLDAADTRRGAEAVHKLYSNKAAVLSGDYLLARASIALARLEHAEVTQQMARSLESLVQGEIMQLRSTAEERLSLEYYLTKSYCKTASLMALSCKSAALLSEHPLDSDAAVAAEKFGYHFGLAFQVSGCPHIPEPAPGALAPHPASLTPRPSVRPR